MEATQKEGPNLPLDKGKEWLETSLPLSVKGMEGFFQGFPENKMEMDTEEQITRKRKKQTNRKQ